MQTIKKIMGSGTEKRWVLPKPEQIKTLLENLGQLQKEPSKEKLQDSNINILEMAEPNGRDFGG